MSEHKLVPFEPTPEMIEAAEDAHMPFGDMDLALRMAVLAAPAVQGEPVAWQRVGRPERIITVLSRRTWKEVEDGVEFRALYSTPQPAEQQPAPDVAGLVEIAKEIVELHDKRRVVLTVHVEALREALAAHRKRRPAPDVAHLVEALETALFGTPLDDVPNRDNDDIWSLCYPHLPERDADALRDHLVRIETALSAHRKQGGE